MGIAGTVLPKSLLKSKSRRIGREKSLKKGKNQTHRTGDIIKGGGMVPHRIRQGKPSLNNLFNSPRVLALRVLKLHPMGADE